MALFKRKSEEPATVVNSYSTIDKESLDKLTSALERMTKAINENTKATNKTSVEINRSKR